MDNKTNAGVHINDLFMWCNDINAIRQFYTEILGLIEGWYDPKPELGPPYVVYKLANNQSLHFLKKNETDITDENWSYQSSSAIPNGIEKTSWTLNVSKSTADEILKRIQQRGAKSYQETIESRSGYSAITLLDPMGNTIDLVYLHS